MARYPVSQSRTFVLDRCGGCAGVWFDKSEFETLTSLNLTNQIHFIFSASWQAEVMRRKHADAADDLLKHKVGDEDFARIGEVRAWLAGHKHRTELLAYLCR